MGLVTRREAPVDDGWILFVNGRWPINPKCSSWTLEK